MERELLDGVEADAPRRDERELEEPCTGDDRRAPNRVTREPRMGGRREPPRQEHLVVRETNHGPEERVIDRIEADRLRAWRGAVRGLEPIALALERIRREIDEAMAIRNEPRGVDGEAGGDELGPGRKAAVERSVVAPERARHGRDAVEVRSFDGLLERQREDGMRAHFDEEADAVSEERLRRLGEA